MSAEGDEAFKDKLQKSCETNRVWTDGRVAQLTQSEEAVLGCGQSASGPDC